MPATPLDILAEELGNVAGRIEREAGLRIDAAIADLRRIDAERELRLVNLERAVADRLALIRDGEPGAAGASVDDVAPMVVAEVARAVAALPAPERGVQGEPGARGESVTVDDVAPLVVAEVARAVAALPAAEKGEKGEPGIAGAGVTLDDLSPLVESVVERAVAALPAAEKGEKGDPGTPGAAGLFPVAKAWAEGVNYEGQVRTHSGATWQALRDTAKEPGHEDWICLAVGGRDGRSPRVRETFDAQVGDYRELDIVAVGGAAFIARKDDPGPCPGAGWQVISTQGKTGKPGERGAVGPRGGAGPAIIRMAIDGQGLLTAANADGSTVECDLYQLLSKLQGS